MIREVAGIEKTLKTILNPEMAAQLPLTFLTTIKLLANFQEVLPWVRILLFTPVTIKSVVDMMRNQDNRGPAARALTNLAYGDGL